MFLDAIFLIAKILAVIAVTIAGVTLLYLLVDFILNSLAERQDVEASIIGIEKEKLLLLPDFYRLDYCFFAFRRRESICDV